MRIIVSDGLCIADDTLTGTPGNESIGRFTVNHTYSFARAFRRSKPNQGLAASSEPPLPVSPPACPSPTLSSLSVSKRSYSFRCSKVLANPTAVLPLLISLVLRGQVQLQRSPSSGTHHTYRCYRSYCRVRRRFHAGVRGKASADGW